MGTILWILVVMWLLHLAVRTPYMRRDTFSDGVYYTVWTLFAGTIFILHYTWMAHHGHAVQALLADAVALILFLLGHGGLSAARTHVSPATRLRTAITVIRYAPGPARVSITPAPKTR